MDRRRFLVISALGTGVAGCLDVGPIGRDDPSVEPLNDVSDDPLLDHPAELFRPYERGHNVDGASNASAELAVTVGSSERLHWLSVLADEEELETTLRLTIDGTDPFGFDDDVLVSEETISLSRTPGAIYELRHVATYELTLQTAGWTDHYELSTQAIDCDSSATEVSVTADGIRRTKVEFDRGEVC